MMFCSHSEPMWCVIKSENIFNSLKNILANNLDGKYVNELNNMLLEMKYLNTFQRLHVLTEVYVYLFKGDIPKKATQLLMNKSELIYHGHVELFTISPKLSNSILTFLGCFNGSNVSTFAIHYICPVWQQMNLFK